MFYLMMRFILNLFKALFIQSFIYRLKLYSTPPSNYFQSLLSISFKL